MTSGVALARNSIAHHGKSFAWASKLLPADVRDAACVLYAWCRRVDDLVDEPDRVDSSGAKRKDSWLADSGPANSGPADSGLADSGLADSGLANGVLAEVRAVLDAIYGPRFPRDGLDAALQGVVRQCGIPRSYFDELLLGMSMDAEGHRYETLDDLLTYCHRVAGVVGLMMAHVLGAEDRAALRHAAHLGIAMQLTNIARDVAEDWQRGRLYLPRTLLAAEGSKLALPPFPRVPFPEAETRPVGRVLRRLLEVADAYYASGDAGLRFLAPRAALSVRTARSVYADIGRAIARNGYDVLAGRARVGRGRKLVLTAQALGATLGATRELPRRPRSSRPLLPPLSFPHDILPL